MPAGFNADERAAQREGGPIVIGGRTYHARRLTNSRLRGVRRASRAATREARAAMRETDEYREAYADAIERGLDEAAAKAEALDEAQSSDEVDQINRRSLIDQLRVLIVRDDMQPPSDEELNSIIEDDLDSRDVGDLMTFLVGTPEDPTTAT